VRTGRVSLVAAADEFRRLFPNVSLIGQLFPGATTGECYCKMVIHHVANEDDNPSGRKVAPILKAQLADRLDRGLPLTGLDMASRPVP
jgi:hypothetical protein